MHNNIPLPPDNDPFDAFIQHALDLDGLPEADGDETWDEAEDDDDMVANLIRRFGSRPFATPPVVPSLPPRPIRRWWHVIRDNLLQGGLFLLTMLLIILTVLEQQQTVKDLNATIAAQQMQIATLPPR